MTQYLVYDVFTQSRFGGNPLAVVLGAENIPEENLLKIAGEFNLPETTFVYAPENPEHTAGVNIRTRGRIALCGPSDGWYRIGTPRYWAGYRSPCSGT